VFFKTKSQHSNTAMQLSPLVVWYVHARGRREKKYTMKKKTEPTKGDSPQSDMQGEVAYSIFKMRLVKIQICIYIRYIFIMKNGACQHASLRL
jgi:hypothetical protein